VNGFLSGTIRFSGIVQAVERALWAFPGGGETLPDILEADRWARAYVRAKSGSVKT
jgi:1-deoxy-D-xylulose 5-phosphate reductoisomerase